MLTSQLFDQFQLLVMGFIEGIHRAAKYFESSCLLCLSSLASPSSFCLRHCPLMMASDSQLLCTKPRSWHSWGQKKNNNNFRYFSFTHFTFLLPCLAVFSFRFLLSALPSRISLAVLFFRFRFLCRLFFFFAFACAFFAVYSQCTPSRPAAMRRRPRPEECQPSVTIGALGELARSVIRIVIAPIIIGLCKPALSAVISPDCSEVSWAWAEHGPCASRSALRASWRVRPLTETLGRKW